MSTETLNPTIEGTASNIFDQQKQYYKDFFNYKDRDTITLTLQIIELVHEIENELPTDIGYSIFTTRIINSLIDAFSIANAPTLDIRDAEKLTNSLKRNVKLRLSKIYFHSILQAVQKAVHDTEKWDEIFFYNLFQNLRNLQGKYIDFTEDFVDAAIAESILTNKHYDSSELDQSFLIDILKSYKKETLAIWNVDFYFKKTDHKALYLTYLFVEYLQLFCDDREAYLQEISNGSIFSKVTAYFRSEKAEDDAKEGLEELKKYAKGKLSKEYHEAKKLEQEVEHARLEKELKEEEIKNLESEREQKNLERENIRLQNQKLELENESKKIQNFKDKISLMKELISDSIITQDEFKIMIKGELYLKKGSLEEE